MRKACLTLEFFVVVYIDKVFHNFLINWDN